MRAAFLALIAGGVWQSQPAVSAEPAVRISAGDFFVPKKVTAAPGAVTFAVRNDGAIEYNFIVEGAGAKRIADIPVIEPGLALEATATVPRGAYTIYCSLPGHREAGMVATLSVR